MERQIAQLYKPLFQYVQNRVNNQEDAEDLTQEVFYKLSKSKSSTIKSVKSWIYTIAKNTITDYYRKKKISTTAIQDMYYENEYDDENATRELSKCVRRFLDELPEDYRSIMILSELEGIPQKEIAEQLGMNYVTVRSKIQRGRKKLRTVFSKCCTIKQGGKGSIVGYQQNKNCQDESNCSHSDNC